MARRTGLLLALLLALGASPGRAEERVLALRGATLLTAAGPAIEDGVLLVRGSRIEAVGAAGEVAIPAGAELRDLAGRTVIPGLVDTHSHVGLYPAPLVAANRDGNETSKAVTPEMRAEDAIWPADPRIRMALAGGITTANIMPGSGNAVGGQTATVKLRGRTVEEMWIRDAEGRPVLGGMKMANGENPKRVHGGKKKAPVTRMAVAFLQRKLFIEAGEYRAKLEGDEPPPRNLRLEPMVEVLEGRRIVHHHTHRADDILTVLRLADEFGHRVVLQHATEAHLVAGEIARRGVPVSIIVTDSPGGKHEAVALDYRNAAVLEEAGVEIAIHSDDFINPSRLLLRSAAFAVRGGMSEDTALRSVTRAAAGMLDLGERLGSLEPGKDADFVVLSGPPFSVWSRVLETWIEGERVFDAADPEDRRFQTGGFQVGERYPASPGGAP